MAVVHKFQATIPAISECVAKFSQVGNFNAPFKPVFAAKIYAQPSLTERNCRIKQALPGFTIQKAPHPESAHTERDAMGGGHDALQPGAMPARSPITGDPRGNRSSMQDKQALWNRVRHPVGARGSGFGVRGPQPQNRHPPEQTGSRRHRVLHREALDSAQKTRQPLKPEGIGAMGAGAAIRGSGCGNGDEPH